MLVVMVKTFESPKRKSHKVHMNKGPTRYLKNYALKIKILRNILHFKRTFENKFQF